MQCDPAYLLHLSPLSPSAGWREAEATDAATRPYAAREHIFLVKQSTLEFAGIQVSGMLCILRVASMTFINHRVKQVCKDLNSEVHIIQSMNCGAYSGYLHHGAYGTLYGV